MENKNMALEVTNPLTVNTISSVEKPKKSEQQNLPLSTTAKTKNLADSVSITEIGQQLNIIRQSLNEHSVVDSGRVKEIKQSLNDGNFHVNPWRVAEKFINFEFALKR